MLHFLSRSDRQRRQQSFNTQPEAMETRAMLSGTGLNVGRPIQEAIQSSTGVDDLSELDLNTKQKSL